MLSVSDVGLDALRDLLKPYDLELRQVADEHRIVSSYWGESEAGIVQRTVFVRNDTPVHSFLHETCHIICMTGERRRRLEKDAGGDDLEEAAVCYLQLVLADFLVGASRAQISQDMDAWGYSFRLGSTLEWFQNDAADAREFLQNHGLLAANDVPVFRLRD